MDVQPRLALGLLLFAAAVPSFADPAWDSAFEQAVAQRRHGNIQASIDALTVLRAEAASPGDRARAAGELGASFAQARRGREAREALFEALANAAGPARARYAVELGNVALRDGNKEDARRHYQEAIDISGARSADGIAAALNLARTEEGDVRIQRLRALDRDIAAVGDDARQAQLQLNIGEQARTLGSSELALRSLEKARSLAARTGDARLQAETFDALAQLHESEGRPGPAMTLTRSAAKLAGEGAPDLRFAADWRIARLQASAGEDEQALAYYERAVDTLEAIRADIPIEYDDGRSSFRATFEPLYLGLADQLLRKAARSPERSRAPYLNRARDVVELLKQAEMQDYLGDRCEVEAINRGATAAPAEGTAILYPLILADRVELLLETSQGIEWRTSPVRGNVLRQTARDYAAALRADATGYLDNARSLYTWLLRPFEATLRDRSIKLLVVVPDSALRLVPFAALHDGERFVVEKLATSVVTGLSMVNPDAAPRASVRSLVAGIARPGPVVDKLPASLATTILAGRRLRSAEQLKERLALPGVSDEVAALGKVLGAKPLLDERFTVDAFERQVRSGDYRIVHVASHGVFGSTADQSFILAYDDLLTMDRLQALLRSDRLRRNPIEILSLSACETAEGDDRSPLGISGAAMKARAKAVVGTLWPVEDEAARLTMERFYGALTSGGADKAQAMRAAQLELVRTRQFERPFFWAPFLLIGNWQ